MARIIKKSGFGIDVASMGELFIALKGKINPLKIMFHGNNKSLEEIEYALINNVNKFVVDNYNELVNLNILAKRLNKSVNVLIRISPMLLEINTHEFISTGQADSKFGINLNSENVNKVFNYGLKSNNLNILGIHFHVGSQLHTNSHVVDAINITFKLLKELKEKHGFVCKELNVGGGFGIYYTEKDKVQPLKYFTDSIYQTVSNNVNDYNLVFPKVIIEPGRYIVGESAITLYTVGAVKEIPHIRNYAAIDGGMTDNLRVALYQAEYDVVVANKPSDNNTTTYTIVGKACESTDKMFKDVQLPKLEYGDILAVYSTGAYENSLANNFNKMLKPATILISKNSPLIIQKRETLDDLIRNDL
jgi:diaminopimelate decarboxylase